jgi:hypothetical protein
MKKLFIAYAFIVVAQLGRGQVSIIRGGESTDPAGQQSQIIIKAGARTIIPATTDTRETKTDTGTRTEFVTRLRDGNGNYVEWQRTSDVVREVSPGKMERTTEVVERTWQGDERERRLIQQSATKTDSGEATKTSEYRRDSSGRMVLARDSSATMKKNINGAVVTTAIVSDYDVNGKSAVTRQIEGVTTTSVDGKLQTTTSTIQAVDHLRGGIGESSREVVTVQTDGNTVRSESVMQRPTASGWDNNSRASTVETRNSDGTIQRETIVEGRSLYGGGALNASLTPQVKTVERQVRQSDGTIVIQRDDYRRDVNGEWKPMAFSMDAAMVGY